MGLGWLGANKIFTAMGAAFRGLCEVRVVRCSRSRLTGHVA
jgi:hypothetical protein